MIQNSNSLIMVAGIGGGGGNAVKHMYSLGVTGVSFMVINTDRQALDRSPIQLKIQLGDGLGAGNNPEKARVDAEQSIDEIRDALTVSGAKMLFVTAGMGGGTGTGASPVVARIAKELGILTVGIVSIPYKGEGPKRVRQAVTGIEALLPCVDSLIVINNEHIAQIYGKLGIKEAHAKADDILSMAAKSISDIVSSPMDVNVDFADVTTIMQEDLENPGDGKIALMGSATGPAADEDSALRIAEAAVNSPLLHHNDIKGAKKVLLSISWGTESVSYDDALKVMDFIQKRAGLDADKDSNQTDVIWGAGEDSTLGDNIRITIVATGFDTRHIPEVREYFKPMLNPNAPTISAPKAPEREVISIDGNDAVSTKKEQKDILDDEFGVVIHHGNTTREAEEEISSRREELKPQRIEVVAPQRVVATPAAEPVVEVMAQSSASVVSNDVNSLMHGDATDLDKPAYLRRGIQLFNASRQGSVTREQLEPSHRAPKEESTISLFDE